MLNGYGDLAIAELVYWAPAIVLAVIVCFRHGFGRQSGWLLIVLLGLARLIGASCTIAEEQLSTPNVGLITAAAITNSIGLSFLISVLVALISRVADGTKIAMLPPRILRLLQLLLLVGIILTAVGGSDLSSGGNDVSEGETLLKVGIILFTVALAATAAGLVVVTINLKSVPAGEKRLVYACWLSLPFVFVRLLLSLISVFAQSKDFNYYHPNIWVRAFMGVAMEFIVVTIILVTGFITQVIPRSHVQRGGVTEQHEMYQGQSSTYEQPKQEYGQASQPQPQYYGSNREQV